MEFFVQELGWTADSFARAQGTWGVLGELCGALLGGFLCDRFGRRRIAAFGGVVLLSEPVTLRLLLASAAILGGVAIVLAQRARVRNA